MDKLNYGINTTHKLSIIIMVTEYPITPEPGIRQKDPISTYIFIYVQDIYEDNSFRIND